MLTMQSILPMPPLSCLLLPDCVPVITPLNQRADIYQPDTLREEDAGNYIDLEANHISRVACIILQVFYCISNVLCHSPIPCVHLRQFQIVLKAFQDNFISCSLSVSFHIKCLASFLDCLKIFYVY